MGQDLISPQKRKTFEDNSTYIMKAKKKWICEPIM